MSRPTVRLDRKGKIVFDFTIISDAPVVQPVRNVVAVDQGKVEMYVATAFTPSTYSAPVIQNRRVNVLQDKIARLSRHIGRLWVKEQATVSSGHLVKSGVLRVERLRLRSKRSRLRVEAAHAMANHLVGVALAYEAEIVFEDLSWVPQSTRNQSHHFCSLA